MKRVEKKLDERGFTLLEVIIAGAIISVGMLAVIPLLLSSYQVDRQTSNKVRAQFVLAQKMDELVSTETPLGNDVVNTDYVNAQTGQAYSSAPSAPVVITRKWVTSKATDTYHPICQMTVTTTYTDQGGTKTFAAYSQKGN